MVSDRVRYNYLTVHDLVNDGFKCPRCEVVKRIIYLDTDRIGIVPLSEHEKCDIIVATGLLTSTRNAMVGCLIFYIVLVAARS